MYTQIFLTITASLLSTSNLVSCNVLRLHRRAQPANPVPITAAEFGTIFDVEVQFGNQTFLLLLDTGSSDTWVVEKDFVCLNPTDGAELPQAACTYGKPYEVSASFEKIQNETFGVHYGTGDATGLFGYESVTIGGINILRQQVGIVNRSTNVGDGIDSGLIGFGHSILTSAHPADFDLSNTSLLLDRLPYNSVFTNMYKRGLVEPYFSLALERTPLNASTEFGGYLALGALPPVSYNGHFANASVEVTEAIPLVYTGGKRMITEWTLKVEGLTYGSSSNSTPFQAVVDSGNYFNVIPRYVADEINAAFDPPAIAVSDPDSEMTMYRVSCNARPPTHGVTIANQTFYHDPRDLILQTGNGCVSSIAGAQAVGGVTLYFLSTPFLVNVVAIFDFEKEEMRFAARKNSSTTSGLPASAASLGHPAGGLGVKIAALLVVLSGLL